MPASPSLLALAVVAALVGDPSAPVSERAVELVEVPPPAPSAEVTITIEVASTPAGDDVEAAAVGVEGPEVAAAPEVPTPAEEIDERARIRRRIGAGVGAAAGLLQSALRVYFY
ncbi:MAG: hypothetical protein KC420_01905 [Myxococcales bacterium]|nr:hypothetical protein [Myxococcales bacterium]